MKFVYSGFHSSVYGLQETLFRNKNITICCSEPRKREILESPFVTKTGLVVMEIPSVNGYPQINMLLYTVYLVRHIERCILCKDSTPSLVQQLTPMCKILFFTSTSMLVSDVSDAADVSDPSVLFASKEGSSSCKKALL